MSDIWSLLDNPKVVETLYLASGFAARELVERLLDARKKRVEAIRVRQSQINVKNPVVSVVFGGPVEHANITFELRVSSGAPGNPFMFHFEPSIGVSGVTPVVATAPGTVQYPPPYSE